MREVVLVDNAKVQIAQDFHEVTSTLRVLVWTPAMRHYLERPGAAELADLKSQFLVAAREMQRYDQIRFIDSNGMEAVRINYNGGRWLSFLVLSCRTSPGAISSVTPLS